MLNTGPDVLPVPEPLRRLRDIAYNLWWTWQPDGPALFSRLCPGLFETLGHSPVRVLRTLPWERLEALSRDGELLREADRIFQRMQQELGGVEHDGALAWAPATADVAYFSAEFSLHESLPIYSGGLGVLSGDHLKSASDLGVRMVGVGLLYRQGYFRQSVSLDGWQLEQYVENPFLHLPVRPLLDRDGAPARITVDLKGRSVAAQAWLVQVGRVPLILLDTHIDGNTPDDREITARLYPSDRDLRIRQEILLGMGGVRMLSKLGIGVERWHMNEGHTAFLVLERIRRAMSDLDLGFEAARDHVAASTVFTTHTPVPAGNEIFDPVLMEAYMSGWAARCSVPVSTLLELGRENGGNGDQPFSMTAFAIRSSAARNGVSRAHGAVARRMWTGLFPGRPEEHVPITHVTNGIHAPTWIAPEMSALFARRLSPRWQSEIENEEMWARLLDVPDEELWHVRNLLRARLVRFLRRRVENQLIFQNAPFRAIRAAREILDPGAMTLGFARRFATYKRATLLLEDEDWLRRLLLAAGRPVQIVFAGKAHPADGGGKDLIRRILGTTRDESLGARIVFVENYDLHVARHLVQGVDLWLNTPRPPLEASGTSGMKAALNGVLHMSTLDGWWLEAWRPGIGFAIGAEEPGTDPAERDAADARALREVMDEAVRLFHERDADGVPRRWIAMMKESVRAVAPFFNTQRMVREYAERFYWNPELAPRR